MESWTTEETDAHKHFQEAVKGDVESLMRESREVWEHRWKCVCYSCVNEFVKRFPTQEERLKVVKEMQRQSTHSEKVRSTVLDVLRNQYEIDWQSIPKMQR